VVKFIVAQGWPFRQHTTFDASASRVLDVLEQVNREIPLKNLRWGLDHCEALHAKPWSASPRSAARSTSRTACLSTARRS